jgi:hypothetical protein
MPEAVREGPASDGPLAPVLILLPTPPPTLLLVLKALPAVRMTKAPTVLIVVWLALPVCGCGWGRRGGEVGYGVEAHGQHTGCSHQEEEEEDEDDELLLVVVVLLLVVIAVVRRCHKQASERGTGHRHQQRKNGICCHHAAPLPPQ